jgi:uncharacterized membrane protein
MIVDRILQSRVKEQILAKGKDHWKRSLVKTFSWRLVGTLDTILISYFLTDSVKIALSIGGIEMVTKMTLYFFHERIWNKIKWGK